jgi:hypothetical protein
MTGIVNLTWMDLHVVVRENGEAQTVAKVGVNLPELKIIKLRFETGLQSQASD